MEKIIITATAESIEQVKQLLEVGVDRIYVGEKDFGLRLPKTFSYDELRTIAGLVHDAGKTLVVAVNALMHQDKMDRIKPFLDFLEEIKTDYKDDVFTFAYSFDYTKLDMQKLKELIPDLNPRDDNTISYSNYKDSLVQQGYKEKQTTAAKENAVQPVQAPEGQEVAVFRATLGPEVTEYIVYHKGDTITKVVLKTHRNFEKFGNAKDTLLKQEKLY